MIIKEVTETLAYHDDVVPDPELEMRVGGHPDP